MEKSSVIVARVKKWRKDNPEKDKQSRERYRLKYKNEIKKRRVLYCLKYKDEIKKRATEWRKKNRERIKIYQERWLAKNPDYKRKPYNQLSLEAKKRKSERLKYWRHKKGITKKTMEEWTNGRTPEENRRLGRKRYQSRRTNAGRLSSKVLQMVYEDNIKKYGTLTCYLCVKPINFGKDTLDHKTPLIRGGDNQYNNLGIACVSCNCRKHTKTEIEYQEVIYA